MTEHPKMKLSSLISSLFFSVALLCIHDIARANGAAWSPAIPTGTPGPLQQTELFLEKEHVTIKEGKIEARFWVHNPSNKDITLLMGFPIYAIYRKDDLGYQFIQGRIANDDLKFRVTSNGSQLTTRSVVDFENTDNKYPIVYTWDITYPANKTVMFTVEYNYFPSESDDSLTIIRSIFYVTHTGAFWAKPIKSAIFEYCNPEFADFIRHNNESLRSWIDNGDASLEVKLNLNPKPYSVDMNTNCIVWQRKNWKPVQKSDDLIIGYERRKKIFVGEDGYIWDGRDGFFRNMCSSSDRNIPLGITLNLLTEKIDEERLEGALLNEIHRQSHTWDGHIDKKDINNIYPPHIMTDLQLLVLRYMRNYIYAAIGHEFEDNALAQCFEDVPRNKELSKIGRDNLKVIIDLENKIKKINSEAWGKIRSNIKKEADIKVPSKL